MSGPFGDFDHNILTSLSSCSRLSQTLQIFQSNYFAPHQKENLDRSSRKHEKNATFVYM